MHTYIDTDTYIYIISTDKCIITAMLSMNDVNTTIIEIEINNGRFTSIKYQISINLKTRAYNMVGKTDLIAVFPLILFR